MSPSSNRYVVSFINTSRESVQFGQPTGTRRTIHKLDEIILVFALCDKLAAKGGIVPHILEDLGDIVSDIEFVVELRMHAGLFDLYS